jgi:uncharacterized Fe-S cluster protein YjdI
MSEPKEGEKHYTNGEITVVWKPDVCIHSKMCWTGLISVFNPKNRPWVNISGATTEKIREQVNKCPSGALTHFMNEAEAGTEVQAESIVEVVDKGPLLVYGNITIKDSKGETKKNKVTAFCRCGHSSNKPYCDGTHRKIDFQ